MEQINIQQSNRAPLVEQTNGSNMKQIKVQLSNVAPLVERSNTQHSLNRALLLEQKNGSNMEQISIQLSNRHTIDRITDKRTTVKCGTIGRTNKQIKCGNVKCFTAISFLPSKRNEILVTF